MGCYPGKLDGTSKEIEVYVQFRVVIKMRKLKKEILLYYIFLFILFFPDNSKYPTIFKHALNILQFTASFYAFLVFIKLKYYKVKALQPLLIWFSWMLVATIINATNVVGVVLYIVPLMASAILAYCVFEKDRENAFRVIAWMLTVLIIIQAFSFATHCFGIVFSQGKWRNYYFFGIRVRFNRIVPVSVFMGLVAWKYGKKKTILPLAISTVLGLYFAVGESVSTSIMCYLIIATVLIITRIIRSEHVWRNLSVFALGLAVVFVFLYAGRNKILQWLFVDVLGEDMTLSDRTVIWNQALSYMKGVHWIIGNGYGHDYFFRVRSTFIVQATHNEYLETIFNFGIIGLLIYIYICVNQFGNVRSVKSSIFNQCFIATFIAIAAMQIPAAVYDKPFYYVFYLASFYLPILSQGKAANASIIANI